MSLICMQMEFDLFNTPLPNIFIDEYMPDANPVFSIVFIMGFRACFHGNSDISSKELANSLRILESDVINAWEYWESKGIVKILDRSADNFRIAFLSINSAKKNVISVVKNNDKLIEKEAETVRTATGDIPSYSVEELELITNKCEEARRLFGTLEDIYGKPLTYKEMNLFLGFYDHLRLPVEVISVMADYCVSNGHTNMRYIEKVALDWADNAIFTAGEAHEYISLFNVDYRKILKAFGQTRRNPTKREISYMKKWIKEYSTPMELITEACERTIVQTGSAKYAYADKILTEWYENDVKTLDDAARADKEFSESSGKKKTTGKKSKGASNRFVNFEGRGSDYYSNFEQIERERLLNSSKKCDQES